MFEAIAAITTISGDGWQDDSRLGPRAERREAAKAGLPGGL